MRKEIKQNIILITEKEWGFIQRRYLLSPKELQVAKLVCRGINNDKIAKKLKIRPGTIKTHLYNTYRRVRVSNKISLLLEFMEYINKNIRRQK